MIFTERRHGLFLEEIEQQDIRFANLAGRPPKVPSPYDDPNKPKHVYVVWLKDPDIIQKFRDLHVRVYETVDEYTGETLYSVRFKAYPKMRFNKLTGKEEQYPRVMLKSSMSTVRLPLEQFNQADSAYVSSVDIKFHAWQYDQYKQDAVLSIDEIWITLDETAGEYDSSYLAEKHGYEDELVEGEVAPGVVVNAAEELPFE